MNVLKAPVLGALIGVLLASLACNVPDALLNIDPTAVAAVDPDEIIARARREPYIAVSPEYFCPGEVVSVTWYVPPNEPDCAADPLHSTCHHASVRSHPYGLLELDPADFEETMHVGGLPDDAAFVQFRLTVSSSDSDGLSANIPANTYPFTLPVSSQIYEYDLTCDPDTLTWQWSLFNEPLNAFPSQCMGVTAVQAGNTQNPVMVSVPDGSSAESQGESTYELNGYSPSEISAEPSDPAYAAVIGTACAVGDAPPINRDGEPENERFTVHIFASCMTSDELRGSSRESCRALGVFEPITSDDDPTPTAPPDGIFAICDLQATCGNGVCDAGCEDAASCGVDCAAESDVCADHGGVAWAGTTCVCPGVIDEVTICGDNTKFDHVTDASCTVDDPAACQPSGESPPQPTACLCTCKLWSQTSYPPTCLKWTDCNGNACNP